MPDSAITIQTVAYGPAGDQVGDLYLPQAPCPPVVCLLHGGFWRMPYGRDEMDAVARDLVARGFAVWNLEYRRIGAPGGGWPGTFEDVSAGIDHLATIAADGVVLDPGRIVVIGHSAGGHLALWCARRNAAQGMDNAQKHVDVVAVAGLAPVADLVFAHDLAVGNDAVAELLGGSPAERPERYRMASPAAMLPLGVKQLVVHGIADAALPIQISRRYARAAVAAGDDVDFIELDGVGHMDFLDPSSNAHAILCEWLHRI
jgi:acetyl esterase/lipase